MFITIITGHHRHMALNVDHIVSVENVDEQLEVAEKTPTIITTTDNMVYSVQARSVILKMIEDARAEHLESTARVFEYALDNVLRAQTYTMRQFGG